MKNSPTEHNSTIFFKQYILSARIFKKERKDKESHEKFTEKHNAKGLSYRLDQMGYWKSFE